MRVSSFLLTALSLASTACATIWQNQQIREVNFPDTAVVLDNASNSTWKTYPANATEIGYKGRWDSKHISCEFNFTQTPPYDYLTSFFQGGRKSPNIP